MPEIIVGSPQKAPDRMLDGRLWRVLRQRSGSEFLEISDELGVTQIAEVHGPHRLGRAALLAAAPEMLAALHEAEQFIAGFEDDEVQQPSVNPRLARIRAAIAMAGGR